MKPVAHPTEIQSNHVSRWDLLASLFLETKLWRYQFCIHRNSVSKEIRVKWPSGCSTFRGSFGSMQVPRYGRNFLDFLTYVQQTHRLLPKFLRVTNKVANSGRFKFAPLAESGKSPVSNKKNKSKGSCSIFSLPCFLWITPDQILTRAQSRSFSSPHTRYTPNPPVYHHLAKTSPSSNLWWRPSSAPRVKNWFRLVLKVLWFPIFSSLRLDHLSQNFFQSFFSGLLPCNSRQQN